MRRRRQQEREDRRLVTDDETRYCGTCGVRVNPGETCHLGARLVPAARLRWWNGDQWQILLLLREYKGVRDADAILLETGWSMDRLLEWGRRLGTEMGAIISPYLYTDNACGVIFFLTPRAREARF